MLDTIFELEKQAFKIKLIITKQDSISELNSLRICKNYANIFLKLTIKYKTIERKELKLESYKKIKIN